MACGVMAIFGQLPKQLEKLLCLSVKFYPIYWKEYCTAASHVIVSHMKTTCFRAAQISYKHQYPAREVDSDMSKTLHLSLITQSMSKPSNDWGFPRLSRRFRPVYLNACSAELRRKVSGKSRNLRPSERVVWKAANENSFFLHLDIFLAVLLQMNLHLQIFTRSQFSGRYWAACFPFESRRDHRELSHRNRRRKETLSIRDWLLENFWLVLKDRCRHNPSGCDDCEQNWRMPKRSESYCYYLKIQTDLRKLGLSTNVVSDFADVLEVTRLDKTYKDNSSFSTILLRFSFILRDNFHLSSGKMQTLTFERNVVTNTSVFLHSACHDLFGLFSTRTSPNESKRATSHKLTSRSKNLAS
ncbi:uncharacterized protein LACBIDRAFT_328970 [Laccaria bicolor S238N-H82]|uniref:Predicted protein n=1 Tax=Laccaria bicolor (strain S238N-H82 / ATCC MYA-4686) TaxID=486041 RepID=B0DGM1_LACBS|nr:uncharacterized protein LACBIDRAFT_328970 [Laccaria bicolor S238N-H82]EDR06295.1 predicted protein [Laccaria bicolor S238N-H82]|eukprot:XP_001883156.1 predicted protein [Laccaria bicolor S238N-H82]